MDVVNLKLSKVGGLSIARQMRDVCVALGIARLTGRMSADAVTTPRWTAQMNSMAPNTTAIPAPKRMK